MLSQFFGHEIVKKLEKTSSTSVTLLSGSKIKLGGLGAIIKTNLILNTATIGAGGMESAIQPSTLYYVYVVNDSGVEKLIATASAIKPLNFNGYRKAGAFYTDTVGDISGATSFGIEGDTQDARWTTFSSSAPVSAIAICNFTTEVYNNGNGLFLVESDSTIGTRITLLKKCKINALWNGAFINQQGIGWSSNASNIGLALSGLPVAERKSLQLAGPSETTMAIAEFVGNPGDVIRPHNGASGSRAGTPADFFLNFTATETPLDWTL